MEVSMKEAGLDINNIDLKSFIGQTPHDIWRSLGVEEERIPSLVRLTGSMMDKNMVDFGELFEGSIESLLYLKEKYQLIICSNCRNSYMDHARYAYDLDKYFSSYITGEDHFFKDKYQILKEMDLGDFIMVGDRENDIKAGLKNNMETIFAKYGYGSLEEGAKASYIIEDIREIMDIL